MSAPAPVPPRPDLGRDAPVGLDDLRERATWRWWEVVGFTVLGFAAGVLAAAPLYVVLDPDPTGAVDAAGLLITAVADVVMAGVLVLWLRARHPAWVRIVGFPPAGRRRAELVAGIGYGLLLEVVAFVAGLIVVVVLESVTGRTVEAPVQVEPGIESWGIVMLVVMACIVAPVVEEFVFRGLLFRSIADRHGFWAGALGSAALFGLSHVAVGSSLDLWALRITLAAVGVVLAWVHWRRRNLLVNIVAHSTFNVIGVAIILAGGRG
jgi:hypothetical protein